MLASNVLSSAISQYDEPRIIQVGQYKIDLDQRIASGQYGDIYLCQDQKSSFAAKIIDFTFVSIDKIHGEIDICQKLLKHGCQHVVQIEYFWYNEQEKKIIIIMELCQRDLQQEMRKRQENKNWFSYEETISIMSQILDGCRFLREQNIMHRDIKPGNILIKNNEYKLTDFGSGKVMEQRSKLVKQSKAGTPLYLAPQILFEQEYSAKCDIFSLGILFYQLIYNAYPYNKINYLEIIQFLFDLEQNTIKCPDEPKIPQETKTLIESMLQYSEEKRISWNDLLEHKLFQQKQTTNVSTNSSSISEQSLQQSKQREFKILEYIKMLLEWTQFGLNQSQIIQKEKKQLKIRDRYYIYIQSCLGGFCCSCCNFIKEIIQSQDNLISFDLINDFDQAHIKQQLYSLEDDESEEKQMLIQKYEELLLLSSQLFKKCQYQVNQIKNPESYLQYLIFVINQNEFNDYKFYLKWFRFFYDNFYEVSLHEYICKIRKQKEVANNQIKQLLVWGILKLINFINEQHYINYNMNDSFDNQDEQKMINYIRNSQT